MTNTFISTATTTQHTMDGGDSTHISGGIQLFSTAVRITGDNNFLAVDGYVRSLGGQGVNTAGQVRLSVGAEGSIFQQSNGVGSAVFISSAGSVASSVQNFGTISGAYGVAITGSDVGNTVENYGSIVGTSFYSAIDIDSDGNFINNYGTMTSGGFGIDIHTNTTGNRIFNEGSISADVGIRFEAGSTISLENFGIINGNSGIAIDIQGSGGKIRNFDTINGDIDAGANGNNMVVVNYGTVNGDIRMGNGTDKYFGRGDSEVAGAVRAGSGADTLDGGNGADYLYGDQGNDLIRAGNGDDVLFGGSGVDTIKGNAGGDEINGGDNSDYLFGGADDDVIIGGGGNDRIHGGRGDDVMTGNSGGDVFIFGRRSDADTITDFENNKDKLDLSAFDVSSRNELFNKGGIIADGSGSMIDLTVVGGDGVIYVEDMSVSDWSASDFIF